MWAWAWARPCALVGSGARARRVPSGSEKMGEPVAAYLPWAAMATAGGEMAGGDTARSELLGGETAGG